MNKNLMIIILYQWPQNHIWVLQYYTVQIFTHIIESAEGSEMRHLYQTSIVCRDSAQVGPANSITEQVW